MAIRFRSEVLKALRSIVNDALYRGSLTLLVNMVAVSAIGFVFWALAAHSYPASTVGVFSSVTSGVGLLAGIAALGLPNTMIRYLATAENPRGLVVVAVTAIATLGTVLCLVTVLALGPHLPRELHLNQRGAMVLMVTALVGCTAVGGTLDAALVATRSSHALLIKNVVGSLVKVGAVFVLVSFRSSGLLISYGLGLAMTTVLGAVALFRRIGGKRIGFSSFLVLRNYLSITTGNYLATTMGILPASIVPLEVLVVRGAAQTARFAIAFLIAGLLNFIPSTVAQVLFAEASRGGVTLAGQLRKALRAVYGLLLPTVTIIVVAAPLVLRLFGTAYATAATGCLRVLALSALLTGGTYLVDSLLIARDRIVSYIFMNGANAALVLGCVGILLHHGLTAAAGGWALAQGLSLLLGLILLATGSLGRHHVLTRPVPAGQVPQYQGELQPRLFIYAFEPQIRELLTAWPMMPTTLIAERIGWDRSIQILLSRVTELRSANSHLERHMSRTRYPAGEIAQCGLWFPPVEIPVGFGQTRSARQLPVLTLITGHSHWLSATLIPSRHAEDLFAGLWELLATLGAVPRVLTWDKDSATDRWQAGKAELADECRDFCRTLGAESIVSRSADPETRALIEWAQTRLERSFLPGRTFASPMDFNAQIRNWLDMINTQHRQPPNRSPAELIGADRQAMLRLPPVSPPTGWHLSMKVGSDPFFRFDSNDYSLDRAMIHRRIEVVADLRKITVLWDGNVCAVYERAWARERIIRAARPSSRTWVPPGCAEGL